MSDVQSADVVQKQRRGKRVRFLKRLIIFWLAAAITVPYVLCTVLFVKLERMENRLSQLTTETVTGGQVREAREAAYLVSSPEDETTISEEVPKDAAKEEALPEENGAGLEIPPDESVSDNTIKVYLTFDDGPSSHTNAILDILGEYQVKATFFVIGKPEETYKPLYKRIVEEGHTIGMHSYSHKYREIYESVDSFREDLQKLRELIYDRCGVMSTLYRFPGGSSNTVSRVDMDELISLLDEEGITYFDWNVSSLDATGKKQSVDDIVENVTGNIQSYHTAVVLMHDTNDKITTVEALPKVIETLKQMDNVELLPITQETVKVQHATQQSAGE